MADFVDGQRLGLRRLPSEPKASSSKKKETLLALSRKYWSVLAVCAAQAVQQVN